MDSQHGRKLMEYIAFISESLEHEINSMKGRHGGGLGAGWEFPKNGGICSSGELILVDSRFCRGQRMAVPKAMLSRSLVETRAVLNGQDLVVLKDVTFFSFIPDRNHSVAECIHGAAQQVGVRHAKGRGGRRRGSGFIAGPLADQWRIETSPQHLRGWWVLRVNCSEQQV